MKKIKWILIILNSLMLFISSYNFLIKHKMNINEWLIVNPSFVFTLIMIIAILLNSRILMSISIPGVFYYGTLGLFLFSWEGPILIAQIGHILMTLGILYMLASIISKFAFIRFALGFFIGLALLIPLIFYQTDYFKKKPEILKVFEDPNFIKKYIK